MAYRPTPEIPAHCAQHEIPVVLATPKTLAGYRRIERDFGAAEIEIVRWPAQGWRPVDDDSGDEGGTTEGAFTFHWEGDVLYGRNDATTAT